MAWGMKCCSHERPPEKDVGVKSVITIRHYRKTNSK